MDNKISSHQRPILDTLGVRLDEK